MVTLTCFFVLFLSKLQAIIAVHYLSSYDVMMQSCRFKLNDLSRQSNIFLSNPYKMTDRERLDRHAQPFKCSVCMNIHSPGPPIKSPLVI